MTLLTATTSVALRVMKQIITSAAGNADPKIRQMVELINEGGQELADKYTWQILTTESAFTTVATESQGLITTLAGADFNFVLNETIWNRSRQRPLFGPLESAQWQAVKAQFAQSPWGQYRIRDNELLINPVPTAGDTVYFEWQSNYWCTDTTGVTGKTAATVDTDLFKLPERLIILEGIWRWKKAQQLDYSEDKDASQIAIDAAMTRDASKPRLNLHGNKGDFFPGYLVQSGNWGIP